MVVRSGIQFGGSKCKKLFDFDKTRYLRVFKVGCESELKIISMTDENLKNDFKNGIQYREEKYVF